MQTQTNGLGITAANNDKVLSIICFRQKPEKGHPQQVDRVVLAAEPISHSRNKLLQWTSENLVSRLVAGEI